MALLAPQLALATPNDGMLTRGKAVDMTVNFFQLQNKNQKFLTHCKTHEDTCYFDFFSRTNFDSYRLKPLILYPDVFPSNSYYHSINMATALGLVRGYYQDKLSPFLPDKNISRAEALKLIMGASGLMSWKDKFELTLPSNVASETINNNDGQLIAKIAGVPSIKSLAWWYPRYMIKALKTGMLSVNSIFQPDQSLTKTEFQKLLDTTALSLKDENKSSYNQEKNFAGNSALQAKRG